MTSRHTTRILLVEDLEEDRRLLADFLHQNNYHLYLAPNGEVAIAVAQKIHPDLILMDVTMPLCDGFTACKRIKSIPEIAHIPLIFLTAATTPDERVKGLKLGAVDYISKPFDFEEVQLRIQIHLKHVQTDMSVLNEPAQVNESLSYRARLNQTLFQAASAQMMSDLSHTPDLNSLALDLRTNKKRLNEAFKGCTELTVFEYLREIRMLQAEKLLLQTAIDINQIALEVGFKNPANFSTAFRQRFGMPPKDYRNRLSGEQS